MFIMPEKIGGQKTFRVPFPKSAPFTFRSAKAQVKRSESVPSSRRSRKENTASGSSLLSEAPYFHRSFLTSQRARVPPTYNSEVTLSTVDESRSRDRSVNRTRKNPDRSMTLAQYQVGQLNLPGVCCSVRSLPPSLSEFPNLAKRFRWNYRSWNAPVRLPHGT